jgi:hypothetical protein
MQQEAYFDIPQKIFIFGLFAPIPPANFLLNCVFFIINFPHKKMFCCLPKFKLLSANKVMHLRQEEEKEIERNILALKYEIIDRLNARMRENFQQIFQYSMPYETEAHRRLYDEIEEMLIRYGYTICNRDATVRNYRGMNRRLIQWCLQCRG